MTQDEDLGILGAVRAGEHGKLRMWPLASRVAGSRAVAPHPAARRISVDGPQDLSSDGHEVGYALTEGDRIR